MRTTRLTRRRVSWNVWPSIINKWGDLLGEYTQSVTQIADPKARADLWVKIGRWYAEHLNRIDYAIASQHRRSRSTRTTRKRSPTSLKRTKKTQQWNELVATPSTTRRLKTMPKKVAILLDLAGIGETRCRTPSKQSARCVGRSVPTDLHASARFPRAAVHRGQFG